MSDRRNIKVRLETHSKLADKKRKMETWDAFLMRLQQEAEIGRRLIDDDDTEGEEENENDNENDKANDTAEATGE